MVDGEKTALHDLGGALSAGSASGGKVPVAKIAKRLGFCRQTIYDEIKRRTYIHTCAYWDEERERPKICRFPGKENAGSAGGWDS